MVVYLAQDIRPFVMYCVNGKPHSSLLIESTDSMIRYISIRYNSPSVLEDDFIPIAFQTKDNYSTKQTL